MTNGWRGALNALVGLALTTRVAGAQGCLPFGRGEKLNYSIHIGFGIRVGRSELTVGDADSVRGNDAMLLRFDMSGGAGPLRATQHTASWVDPTSLATLRFVKHERSPLTKVDDSVEVFPRERRWSDARGAIGYSPSDLPLDELSFLYFVRTLSLGADSAWLFSRHYDPARSPTSVKVLGHELLKTDLGPIETWKVELKVRDPAHFRGLGRMTIWVSDDADRVPIRIETDMREAGSTVMELTARTAGSSAERGCASAGKIPDRDARSP